ncbi:hypothetical protein [Kribbella italica]|uniref:Uncharacterized protein n=1 Tax=Kribbella italica TaxID=1540520 RepID=A0A7W9JFE3_9ACTN|nr:hypothetical protein [Kribbella italica]MBB5840508.1 hypothetical protein [Kribbella italica]
MSTIKPLPLIVVRDGIGRTGWLHNCGAFVYYDVRPNRCGVCWSAMRNRQAFNGSWTKAYTNREAS